MLFIYVLELEDNKYYIGKTSNLSLRLDQHFNSSGSEYTKKYKPIRLYELIPDCDDYDEDKYTLKYIKKFGIDNVRGGSFCEFNISKEYIATINKMINSSNNNCFICGLKDHFAKDCKKYKKKSYYPDNYKEKQKVESFIANEQVYNNNSATSSFILNKLSIDEHTKYMCIYCNKEFDTKKGCIYHENVHCKNKKIYSKEDLTDNILENKDDDIYDDIIEVKINNSDDFDNNINEEDIKNDNNKIIYKNNYCIIS